MTGTKSLLGWSGFIFLLRLGGAVVVLLTQVLLARWMGAHELGVYVLAFSWLIMLSTVVGLGFPMASMRIVGQAQHDDAPGVIRGFVRRGRAINLAVGTVVAASGIAVTLLFRDRLDSSQVESFVAALLCVPILAMMRMHERVAQAHGWFVLAMLPNMFLRPVLFLLSAWVAMRYWSGLDAARAITLHVGLIGLMALVHFLLFGGRLRRQWGRPAPVYHDREWVRTALPLLIVTVFSQYFADLDIAILGFLLSPEQLALYNAGYRVALVISFGFLAVNAVLMPRVSRLHAAGDTAAIQKIVTVATRVTLAGASVALLLLHHFGRDILALFGESFVSAHRSLMILAASQVALAAIGPVAILLSATGHQLHCLNVFLQSLVLLVVASVALTPPFGIEGAAAAVLLVTLYWALLLRRRVRERLRVEPSIFAHWLSPPR